MVFTEVLEYKISDIDIVTLQWVSDPSPTSIHNPNNTYLNYVMERDESYTGYRWKIDFSKINADKKEYTETDTNYDIKYNVIALFDIDRRLLAYYIFSDTQICDTVKNWHITIDIGDTISPMEFTYNVTNLVDAYTSHILDTDLVVGNISLEENPGIFSVHDNLHDIGISSWRYAKDKHTKYKNARGINTVSVDNSVVSVKDTHYSYKPTISSNITILDTDTKIRLGKCYNPLIGLFEYCIYKDDSDNYKIKTYSLEFKDNVKYEVNTIDVDITDYIDKYDLQLDISVFSIYNITIISQSGNVISIYNSSPIEVKFSAGIVISDLFYVSGVIGKIFTGPVFPNRLLNYYWGISNNLKNLVINADIGDNIVWQSPVSMKSGNNDHIVYSLLSKYIDEGILDNLVIDMNSSQEILLVVKKKELLSNIELTMNELFFLYSNFPDLCLENFNEKWHRVANQVYWVYPNKDFDNPIVPTVNLTYNNTYVSLDKLSADHVSSLVYMCGKVFNTHILPYLDDDTKFYLSSTHAYLIKSGGDIEEDGEKKMQYQVTSYRYFGDTDMNLVEYTKHTVSGTEYLSFSGSSVSVVSFDTSKEI